MSDFRWDEARALLCGNMLGEGAHREVYVCKLDETCVVKVELRGQAFQNVEEWRAWWWAGGTPKSRWLVPVKFISPNGLILIQERVTPMRPGERPKKLPGWLCDLKDENFGMLNGKVVACDYGTVLSTYRDTPNKLVKAKWKEPT